MGGDRGTGRERGAAAVEFALVAPLLLLLIFGLISYGYMFSFRQALSQAASEGARAAVGAPSTGTCAGTAATFTSAACPAQYAAAEAVASALSSYGMACGTKNLTCAIPAPSAVGCESGHTCITVTVSYPYRDHSLLPTVPGLGFTLPQNLAFTTVVEVA